MAQVTLSVGGRPYSVACRDGEEAHLRRLGELLDARASEAKKAVGGVNEVRQLLLAGLLLADELNSRDAPRAEDTAAAEALEALAERVESMAAALEENAANA